MSKTCGNNFDDKMPSINLLKLHKNNFSGELIFFTFSLNRDAAEKGEKFYY